MEEQFGNDNQLIVLLVTILVLIFAVLWYKYKSSNSSNGAPPLPPGPRSLPIIGHIPFLSPGGLHKQFTNMAHTYGPIFKFKLGSKLYIVLNTPELLKEVVRDQDDIFANRDRNGATYGLSHGGQDISFSDNNATWRMLRKIFVREMLSNKNLEATASFRTDEVRKTVKDVFGKLGTKVNIRDVGFSTSTHVLKRTIWGSTPDTVAKIGNLAAELDLAAENVVQLLGRMNLSDFFPILARFDLQGVARDMKKQIDKLDQLFSRIIEDRIETNLKMSQDDGKRDFLQVLLDYKDDKDGTSLNMTQIKSILVDIMIAGTETTATTVEWVMTDIMRSPKIMKKIQEELVEIVGLNNIVEEHHLPQLKYLDATIKEAMRIHPTTPLLVPRVPSKTCTVGGYTVPKGSLVFLNIWSIQRDPRYWENPLEFNPDRFMSDKWDYRGTNLAFAPLGAGRRTCAGIPLADKMLMFILASLLHSFDWSLPEGEKHDITEIYTFALRKKIPLIAIPSQRLSDVSLYM